MFIDEVDIRSHLLKEDIWYFHPNEYSPLMSEWNVSEMLWLKKHLDSSPASLTALFSMTGVGAMAAGRQALVRPFMLSQS